jgi:hypothetical protein
MPGGGGCSGAVQNSRWGGLSPGGAVEGAARKEGSRRAAGGKMMQVGLEPVEIVDELNG